MVQDVEHDDVFEATIGKWEPMSISNQVKPICILDIQRYDFRPVSFEIPDSPSRSPVYARVVNA